MSKRNHKDLYGYTAVISSFGLSKSDLIITIREKALRFVDSLKGDDVGYKPETFTDFFCIVLFGGLTAALFIVGTATSI